MEDSVGNFREIVLTVKANRRKLFKDIIIIPDDGVDEIDVPDDQKEVTFVCLNEFTVCANIIYPIRFGFTTIRCSKSVILGEVNEFILSFTRSPTEIQISKRTNF